MKKTKKIFISLLLAIILVLSLAGCNLFGGGNKDDTSGGNDSTGILTPSSPEIELTDPETEQPDVPDKELAGDIDTDQTVADPDLAGYDGVIILNKTAAEISGKNITAAESGTYGLIININASGTYVVQGTLTKGFVAVAKKELEVTLILNGVNIYSPNYAPIVCTKKSDVVIELSDNSTNYLTDGTGYVYDYDADHEPNACLYIRKDLEIRGSGALIVNASNNNGIGTKANLKIAGGNIKVNAVNNVLKGNDSINISGGNFELVSHQDGIKSDNIEEDGLGYISITGGVFNIVAVNDAVQSSTSLTVSGADMKMKTGGGSAAAVTTASAKGLKAATTLTVGSGALNIDSNDDGIHSNGDIVINGGTIIIASGDDGIHADNNLTVNGGTIEISKSYEGLESQNINLNGGSVRLLASDDGINISGGSDNSGTAVRPGGRPGTPGQSAIDGTLTITGGSYYINASGDGLDSNGNIVMSGGLVIVHGPTSEQDAPIDYDGTFTMTKGTIIALGSSQMAQQPGSSSTQYSALIKFSSAVSAGKLINLKNSAGTDIVTIACIKQVKSIVVCSPELGKGSYTVSTGGTYSAAANEYGLYTGGAYSGGTSKTFTISSITTTVTV